MNSRKFAFYHIIGLFLAIFLVLGLMLAQLFVRPDYSYLFNSITSINKSALAKAFGETHLKNTVVPENLIPSNILSKNNLPLIDWCVNYQKNQVAVLLLDKSLMLHIYSLHDGTLLAQHRVEGITGNIVQWAANSDDLYLATKQTEVNWRLLSIDSTGHTSILLEKITYPNDVLVKMIYPVDKFIYMPVCTTECSIEKYAIPNKGATKVEIQNDYQIKQIDNFYYDSLHDRIIFKATDNQEELLFALDSNGYQWHKIYLFNDQQKQLELKGFRYSDKNIELLAYSPLRNEIYLYDLSYIGLQIVKLKDGENFLDQIISNTGSNQKLELINKPKYD